MTDHDEALRIAREIVKWREVTGEDGGSDIELLARALIEAVEARDPLKPLTPRQIEEALAEGRAESRMAQGDNAWTTIVKQRDEARAQWAAASASRWSGAGCQYCERETCDTDCYFADKHGVVPRHTAAEWRAIGYKRCRHCGADDSSTCPTNCKGSLAERDSLRAESDEARLERFPTELAKARLDREQLRAELAAAQAERSVLACDIAVIHTANRDLLAERDEARREVERWVPVITAVKAWRDEPRRKSLRLVELEDALAAAEYLTAEANDAAQSEVVK